MSLMDIYALGSPYGIDRLAWSVLECMVQAADGRRQLPWRAHCLCGCEQLLDRWSRETATNAAILDTLVDGSAEDIVFRRVRRDELDDMPSSFSGHGLALGTILKLSDQLHLTPQSLVIVGLTVPDARMAHPQGRHVELLAERLRSDLLGCGDPELEPRAVG